MHCRAPAKLNLFLHVTGRRPDGFHDLETVFQLVDLCDELDVEVRDDGRIVRDPPPSDPLLASLAEEEDLTVRAARLLQQASGTRLGAAIHVTKHVPAGGGLGGGSSDAAAVLLALNTLWSLDLPRARLAELGLSLGSDVPVFVAGRSAFARGRGEQLTPVELPPRWFLIVHPGVSVSTREIFNAPELTRDSAPLRIAGLPDDGGRNDCEAVVRQRYPVVAQALDLLAPYGARLTGTGACVFVGHEDLQQLKALAATLPVQWKSFIVRGLLHTEP
jgi:4-diphosphocytidyl-2-C-methyl-D-erythritol kinase